MSRTVTRNVYSCKKKNDQAGTNSKKVILCQTGILQMLKVNFRQSMLARIYLSNVSYALEGVRIFLSYARYMTEFHQILRLYGYVLGCVGLSCNQIACSV